jgi:Asp-tRNA(Asn)/Glu-tRNA(Gln) amidotransferase A subunit family amidase
MRFCLLYWEYKGGPYRIAAISKASYFIDISPRYNISTYCGPHWPGLGYPIVTVPLELMESNDQPYGFFVVARANEEKKLLAFMNAFEAMFPARKTPPRLS